MENAAAIKDAGDGELLSEVNGIIQFGRRQHARAPLQLDTVLHNHGERLRRRAHEWHEERDQQLR
ncbi:hypothetical protein GN244_ATG14122 [Phytophthora infestans]|uniref:Uncharacterized protein n=1 Tax=Phytophthora infestans TaxID=4787 RepID=A0A833SNF9_PHYIN|nr:hypothetical protein GN244_ATG14122 [Phytophthora infestans]